METPRSVPFIGFFPRVEVGAEAEGAAATPMRVFFIGFRGLAGGTGGGTDRRAELGGDCPEMGGGLTELGAGFEAGAGGGAEGGIGGACGTWTWGACRPKGVGGDRCGCAESGPTAVGAAGAGGIANGAIAGGGAEMWPSGGGGADCGMAPNGGGGGDICGKSGMAGAPGNAAAGAASSSSVSTWRGMFKVSPTR
jgi:hypothetical protein